ncbi:Claudin-22 [Channa argus]|uniref:Claudin n=1 Tax=Channa argus TaxID=215402 RepID=A0A6G1PDZ9_CHAAH|nr:Claudin-22 [Channa argus]KAK2917230.1 hypothetical protein Q8A73_003976 [Channa argus]
MDSSLCALELLGVFCSVVAWLATLSTTLMSTWLTQSTALLSTESIQLGLWETCVVQDLGGLECRPYDTLLGLRQDIMVARTLMCVALAVGMLGLLLTIPGLHLVNSCQGQVEDLRCKSGLRVSGGAMCLLAGILVLVPVSYFANVAVIQFFDETVPEMVPRWEFGDALFCGWTAGFVYLVAGTMLLTSCLCQQGQNRNTPVPIPMVGVPPGIPFTRVRSEYV